LNANEYQRLAGRTLNPALDSSETLLNAVLGLTGESGEVADKLKKHLFHGHVLNAGELLYELGDILWYVSQAASALNINLSTIMEMNIEKLEKRYPGGFSSENSINRSE
jgi:NTP pyrophosphatase (non-canonical NTP hydrolase)